VSLNRLGILSTKWRTGDCAAQALFDRTVVHQFKSARLIHSEPIAHPLPATVWGRFFQVPFLVVAIVIGALI